LAKKAAPRKGDAVEWTWGKGRGEGRVTAVHKSDVTETIKGAKVTRHASPEKPAVDIKTSKGGKVLKSTTEIKKK
jgi:ribosomal protein L24